MMIPRTTVDTPCTMLDKGNKRTSDDGRVTVAKYERSEGDTGQAVNLLRAITQIGNKTASLLRGGGEQDKRSMYNICAYGILIAIKILNWAHCQHK